LEAGSEIALTPPQAHYLGSVMRAVPGEALAVFNGRDGEWLGRLATLSKGRASAVLDSRLRPQAPEPDLWLLAAPIKRGRIDWVAEKATELGVSRFWPVLTRRTQAERVNRDRLAAHLVEAAEQCERLTLPDIPEPVRLPRLVEDWPAGRILLFLDESGGGPPLAEALADIPAGPLAVLVGPEGGFAPEERAMLAELPDARPVSLGPRILRAETAALAALAVVQALAGDWRGCPPASAPRQG
jgi:16S rRNA (uracil1498-N3)-methyltransferase